MQRLSKSVSMVTKGIVKEHLILLANSMTYTGSMIGFNSGGIKALSKSSNVRGPFAEATLFTPKKCFERAAEKGHFDSLSSIVASCSWGKQVSVGTGSKFDLLWDTREVEKNEGIDVYEFLHLVRSTKDKAADSGGLGADVDDYDDGEWAMSPEHGSEKPTFEDTIEFSENQVGNLGNSSDSWGQGNDGKWGAGATTTSSKPSAWSSWGSDTTPKEDITKTPLADERNEPAANAWGSTPEPSSRNIVSTWGSGAKEDNNNIEKESVSDSWGTASKNSELAASKGWGASADVSPSLEPSWGSEREGVFKVPAPVQEDDSWGTASKSKPAISKGWGTDHMSPSPKPSWGSEKEDVFKVPAPVQEDNSWGTASKSKPAISQGWGTDHMSPSPKPSWGSEKEDVFKVPAAVEKNNTWGSSSSENSKTDKEWGNSSNQKGEASSGEWGNSGGTQSSWGKVVSATPKPIVQSSWGNLSAKKDDSIEKPTDDSAADDSWGSGKRSKPTGGASWGPASPSPEPNAQSTWGNVSAQKDEPAIGGKVWGADETQPDSSSSWGMKPTNPREDEREDDAWKSSSAVKSAAGGDSWGKKNGASGGSTWGAKFVQKDDNNPPPSSPSNSQWGQARRFGNNNSFQKRDQDNSDSPRGWGSSGAGEWRQKTSSAHFTATRQRLDMFTSEEQEIVQVIEPLMLSIRRIMHQSGYNDEDPFSAEDQAYILDNVFNYHPEKTAKMGVGIEHIMVNKHSEFQDSRCLWVVLTDGHKEDFSYRKCLENFVRTKYPELAEDFNGKYFKKPQPRPPINRDRSVGPAEEAAATGQQEESEKVGGNSQEESVV